MIRIDVLLLATCLAFGAVSKPVIPGVSAPPEPPEDRGQATSVQTGEENLLPSLPPVTTLQDEEGERVPYVQIEAVLRSLLPAKGITHRFAPASLELSGLVSGYKTIRYSFDLTIDAVQVFFRWKDGKVRSAWFVARFQADQGVEHVFYDREKPEIGSLVTLELTGAFVHRYRIDWENCRKDTSLDDEVCWLGWLVEEATLPPLSSTFLADGYAPGHPRYGFLVGWAITPLELETTGAQAGGQK